MEFNSVDTNDEMFDEYFLNKRDLGKILRETTKLVGVKTICPLLQSKLDATISFAQ